MLARHLQQRFGADRPALGIATDRMIHSMVLHGSEDRGHPYETMGAFHADSLI